MRGHCYHCNRRTQITEYTWDTAEGCRVAAWLCARCWNRVKGELYALQYWTRRREAEAQATK